MSEVSACIIAYGIVWGAFVVAQAISGHPVWAGIAAVVGVLDLELKAERWRNCPAPPSENPSPDSLEGFKT